MNQKLYYKNCENIDNISKQQYKENLLLSIDNAMHYFETGDDGGQIHSLSDVLNDLKNETLA